MFQGLLTEVPGFVNRFAANFCIIAPSGQLGGDGFCPQSLRGYKPLIQNGFSTDHQQRTTDNKQLKTNILILP